MWDAALAFNFKSTNRRDNQMDYYTFNHQIKACEVGHWISLWNIEACHSLAPWRIYRSLVRTCYPQHRCWSNELFWLDICFLNRSIFAIEIHHHLLSLHLSMHHHYGDQLVLGAGDITIRIQLGTDVSKSTFHI
jgi:hypothetical protein